jgi:hypothetical protein
MRNKFGGKCILCEEWVGPNEGYFERHKHKWCVRHIGCSHLSQSQQDKIRDRVRKSKLLDIKK